MKKISTALLAAASILVLSQAASAADMSRPVYKAPPLPAAPMWTWTGLYIGGHIGGGWASETATVLPTGVGVGTDPGGFLGGAQIGYNWQINPTWVIGIEGDWSWTGASSTTAFTAAGIPGTVNSDHNWYSTLAGRLGYTSGGPWMVYAKGGGAWMNADYTATLGGVTSAVSNTRSGWMVGAGLEWMFTPNWTAKVEYNYMDFGTNTYTFLLPAGTAVNFDTQVNVVKAGVNYKF
jgi:outer membrane immunogenic protein